MKSLKKVFFSSIALFAASLSVARTNPLNAAPLKFSTGTVSMHFKNNVSAGVSTDLISAPSGNRQPSGIDPVVHYPAFFCKMELRSVDRFGVWIKVHAGDYDTYSKPAFSH